MFLCQTSNKLNFGFFFSFKALMVFVKSLLHPPLRLQERIHNPGLANQHFFSWHSDWFGNSHETWTSQWDITSRLLLELLKWEMLFLYDGLLGRWLMRSRCGKNPTENELKQGKVESWDRMRDKPSLDNVDGTPGSSRPKASTLPDFLVKSIWDGLLSLHPYLQCPAQGLAQSGHFINVEWMMDLFNSHNCMAEIGGIITPTAQLREPLSWSAYPYLECNFPLGIFKYWQQFSESITASD